MRPAELQVEDAVIEDAVAYAEPMALRGVLFQLTGDESLASIDVEFRQMGFAEVAVPVNDADVSAIRARGAAFLKAVRDGSEDEVSIGPGERLPRSMGLTAGEEIPEAELGLWLEELALDPWARGLERQTQPTAARLRDFSVIVVGAGMGGLAAAVQLRHAGIRFKVIEKNSGVGGTWYENRYPGARVDTSSRTYLHSFGAEFPLSSPFFTQSENEAYFDWVADRFDVRRHVEFNTEITSCVWDDATATWVVRGVGPDGPREWRANALISAVGFLSRPSVPQIEGSDQFEGRSFHTARWPDDLELAGKRVAVIGTGCSGYQTAPEIALTADHVYLFQRTPQWVLPTSGYRSPFPRQVTWLDRNFPFYVNFMRYRAGWIIGPKRQLQQKTIDPNWTDPDSCNATNKRLRDGCLDFLRAKLGDRPDLLAAMVPPHPVWSARPVLVDEQYSIFDALLRDNVTLVTGGIRRMTPEGIEGRDGELRAVDIIVYATGFKANDFLAPMMIIGRSGTSLEDVWTKDGPRAYLGSMVPGFPNLFLIYGPNTNPMGGLSVVSYQEMAARFALECTRHLIVDDRRALEVTPEAYWRYNELVDREEQRMVYTDRRANNYYRSSFGRSAANCPFGADQMWAWLRKPVLDDFVVR